MSIFLQVFLSVFFLSQFACKPKKEESSETSFLPWSDPRHSCLKSLSRNRNDFIKFHSFRPKMDSSLGRTAGNQEALSICVEVMNSKFKSKGNIKASSICGIKVDLEGIGGKYACKLVNKLASDSPRGENTGKCTEGDSWETVVSNNEIAKDVCADEYNLIFDDVSGSKDRAGAYCISGSALKGVVESVEDKAGKAKYRRLTCKVVGAKDPAYFE